MGSIEQKQNENGRIEMQCDTQRALYRSYFANGITCKIRAVGSHLF